MIKCKYIQWECSLKQLYFFSFVFNRQSCLSFFSSRFQYAKLPVHFPTHFMSYRRSICCRGILPSLPYWLPLLLSCSHNWYVGSTLYVSHSPTCSFIFLFSTLSFHFSPIFLLLYLDRSSSWRNTAY